MLWRKGKPQNLSKVPKTGQKFEHTLKSRSSELLDQIARTQSSPFFPIKDPALTQQIRIALAKSFESGNDRAQLKASLSKLISDPKLADDIGHTESVYLFNASIVAHGKEKRATDKTWYNSTNPCDDCLALNEKQVKIDVLFGVKDKIGHPPLHYGCNCGMRLVYGTGYDLGL